MNQVERIILKLQLAKSTDFFLEVFGADSHKYIIGNPLSTEDVVAFEKSYNINLPECYTAFLTKIGNGGIYHEHSVVGNSAAGPDYGIFSLGHPCQFISEPSLGYLQNKTLITSGTNEEEWDNWYNRLPDNCTDDDYEKIVAKAYSGILQIGYSGCSNYHSIILNGNDKGQVLETYDEIEYCPQFVKQNNFLDWYENWLDEIIDGTSIIKNGASIMSESECLNRFLNDKETYWKLVSLAYIRNFDSISNQTIKKLWDKYKNENDNQIKKYLSTLLVKFDYINSISLLRELSQADPLLFLVTLHLYSPKMTFDWNETIKDFKTQYSNNKSVVEYIDNVTAIDINNYN